MNIRLSVPFRLMLAALFALSLQACATRGPEIGAPAPSDASSAAWQAYQSYASARASDHGPYRLGGSLRYGSQGDTRRVETLLWSNGYLPIRLDVMAGIGALVARIQETQDSFTAYAPNENKAIVHKGPQRVQLNFGRPVPFSLRDFSSLMRGRFHGRGAPSPRPAQRGHRLYALRRHPAGDAGAAARRPARPLVGGKGLDHGYCL